MAIVEFKGGPITHRYLMNKRKDDLARMLLQSWDTGYSLAREIRAIGDRLREDGYHETSNRLELVANRLGGARPGAENVTFCDREHATRYPDEPTAFAWLRHFAQIFPLYTARMTLEDGEWLIYLEDGSPPRRMWIFDGHEERKDSPC